MARTADRHRSSQAAFVSLIPSAIRHAWLTLFNPHDLKGSSPRLTAATEALVTHYGRASAAAALTYYRNERRAAGVTGPPPRLPMPQLPSHADLTATVEHVLSPLYGPADPVAEQKAQDALASEVEQMVLDQSRQAIIEASHVDKEAKGWARVTEPDACSFCRLLATRGAVYGSEASADFRAHTKQPNGSGGTCRCHAEPVFNTYEMTAQARQDLADYQRLAEEYGHSGRDILIAWRQHVEGRDVTGPLTKPYTRKPRA